MGICVFVVTYLSPRTFKDITYVVLRGRFGTGNVCKNVPLFSFVISRERDEMKWVLM